MEQEARPRSYDNLITTAEQDAREMRFSEAAAGFLEASEHAGLLKHRLHIEQARFFHKLAGEPTTDSQSRIDQVRADTASMDVITAWKAQPEDERVTLDKVMATALKEYGEWLKALYGTVTDEAYRRDIFDEAAGAFAAAANVYEINDSAAEAQKVRELHMTFRDYVRGRTN